MFIHFRLMPILRWKVAHVVRSDWAEQGSPVSDFFGLDLLLFCVSNSRQVRELLLGDGVHLKEIHRASAHQDPALIEVKI